MKALIDALFKEVNPIPVKTALNLMGKDVGGFRLPLCEMSQGPLENLKEQMRLYGLL
jgi:4-hydroxy-tetrahydrodipicolinate synthase